MIGFLMIDGFIRLTKHSSRTRSSYRTFLKHAMQMVTIVAIMFESTFLLAFQVGFGCMNAKPRVFDDSTAAKLR